MKLRFGQKQVDWRFVWTLLYRRAIDTFMAFIHNKIEEDVGGTRYAMRCDDGGCCCSTLGFNICGKIIVIIMVIMSYYKMLYVEV